MTSMSDKQCGPYIATVGSDMHELHEAGHARLWLFISVSVRNGLVGGSER
jgi:hypothetical protein